MAGTDPHVVLKLAHVVGKGRTLLVVAATEVVLFVVANVTYGNGNDTHGAMRSLSNVVWALFLVGFFVLIVCAIVALVQLVQRRVRRTHTGA